MDDTYGSQRLRPKRNNLSLQHINRLSLAPMTLKWPLSDPESLMELDYHSNYMSDRSIPTTPSILSRTPSCTFTHKTPRTNFPKSKSSSHLLTSKASSVGINSGRGRPKNETRSRSLSHHRSDSVWLLRAGAVMISSAREAKGQDWLVSRASSTSIRRLQEDDHKEWERAYLRESEHQSKLSSARGSTLGDNSSGYSSPKRSMSMNISPTSRIENYPLSRRESKILSLNSPMTKEPDNYFEWKDFSDENKFLQEPELLDTEYVCEDEEAIDQDEAIVKDFSRAYNKGIGGWVEKILKRRLFTMDDEIDDIDTDDESEKVYSTDLSKPSLQSFDIATFPVDIDVPPAQDGDVSVWEDAVWFLNVAMKALL
ncbi:hypothetical protein GcM3_085009 [Golovinomyces cichoracearum]|uniref:Uncharacterized protein n=1 Tax=Golovinomyces cichoracearum TaxID=62708 RepID=A0A420ILM4_9PEZI|nr:hypothetical protein GcM3_085009 [Golovinomyces cichoracearum]